MNSPALDMSASRDDVESESLFGKCHVCGYDDLVDFCSLCGHWMCEPCRGNLRARARAAGKQAWTDLFNAIMSRKTQGFCCGPEMQV